MYISVLCFIFISNKQVPSFLPSYTIPSYVDLPPQLLSLATALQSSSIFGYCPPVLFYLWLLPSSPLLSLATALQSSSIFGYCPPVLFYLWLLPSSPLLSLATALQSSSIFGYCPPVLFYLWLLPSRSSSFTSVFLMKSNHLNRGLPLLQYHNYVSMLYTCLY